MSLPLEGIRVLDLGISTAGPYAARFLADLGADVIKVEPLNGENSRSLGLRYGDAGYLFHVNNYNKRSLALRVQHADGRRLFLELVARSDVVIENFAVGTMNGWGIGYDACRTANPSIIYCSAKGFGESGALREKRAFDTVVQGLAGVMDATGETDSPPLKGGPSVCDLMTASASVMAVTAAIVARVPGQSTLVDTSLFDLGAWSLLWLWPHAMSSAPETAVRIGNAHPAHAPYGVVACADGDLFVSVTSQSEWVALAALLGMDAGMTVEARLREQASILQRVAGLAEGMTAAHCAAKLAQAGVPAAPVLGLQAVADLALIDERELITEIDHPVYGRIPLLRSPLAAGDLHRLPIRALPPTLGQHTREIMAELPGYPERFDALRDAGVVGG